ncbi:MAG: ABC transporter permease subunit [Myxococcaceae bacterium]|nr:ABC transporter permease subunit [Myxococcaceae bacterium]
MSPVRRLVPSLLVVAIVCACWWGLAAVEVGGRSLVASPWQTAAALPGAWRSLGGHLLATLGRSAAGFLVGSLGGVALGLLAAGLRRRAPVVDGLLDFARSIPPVVLFPLALLAFGYTELSRVVTVALACAWLVALAVTTAARPPASARAEVLGLAGATRWQRLRWTQPWEGLAALVVGVRSAASMAIIVAVVTEMVVGVAQGLGSDVVSAQIAGDEVRLTLDVLGLGLLGFALNAGLRALEAWASRVTGSAPA